MSASCMDLTASRVWYVKYCVLYLVSDAWRILVGNTNFAVIWTEVLSPYDVVQICLHQFLDNYTYSMKELYR